MQVKLDYIVRVEVRRYPSLDDAMAYDEVIYHLGALISDGDGVSTRAFKRITEDGRTEVLSVRLLPPE
jgi:hypothetical protein